MAPARLPGACLPLVAASHTSDIMHMQIPLCDVKDQILDVHGRKMVHVRASGTLMNGEKKIKCISLNEDLQNWLFYFDTN